jgi:CDP-glycerol glycerophosphotransferase (TagB/SpsB family)
MHDVLIRQIGRLDMASSQHSFGLQNGRQTIAVLSSKFTDTQYRTWFVEGVLEAMQAMPEAQCIIKLHPSESADLWLESAEQRGMSAPVIVGNRLWDVIAVADLIVSWYSTTVLDAMMLEKPVVIYANNDRSLAPAFVGRNGIETVGDVEQLVAAITDLMGVKISRRALLEGELYRLDGRASQRLVQLVVDLSNEYKSTGMSTDRLSPIAVGD